MNTEEREAIISKSWQKTQREFINGVNPHAYRLGFLDALKHIEAAPRQSFGEWLDENCYCHKGYWHFKKEAPAAIYAISELFDIFTKQQQ